MSAQNPFREIIALHAAQGADRAFITEPHTGKVLTFAELARRTGAIGAELRRHGFRAGGRVALSFRNGIQAALAFLSVTAHGGIAVPVNPGHTARELAFILEHAEARFLLAAAEEAPELENKFAHNGKMRPLPENLRLYAAGKNHPRSKLPPGAALLLYTSGTTGRPKGVPLTRNNLLAEAGNIRKAHALTPDDRALCLLPLYHINGLVVTLLTPLFTGMEVIMPPRFSANSFWGWVREYKPTWFSAVPTIYSLLLSKPMPGKDELAGLRFARSASAALPETVLREFEQRTGIPVIESYGLSEGGSQITSNPLPPALRKPGSVGLAFGNEIRVKQTDGSDAPMGVEGEVAVRGANLASAYFNNPEATRESFRSGWFFTGDLGHMDADGYLFLTGRKKELINRAGEMISPRELDEVLYQFPLVQLAASVGVPHPLYGEEVVAFLQMRDGQSASAEAVLAFCAERLAGFKIPKRIYFTDDFPKGPSGKIQRRKLAERYLNLPEAERLPAAGEKRDLPARYAVHLDAAACKACGYCALVCPGAVFAQGGSYNEKGHRFYLAVNPEQCIGCLRCFHVCPDFCLEPKKISLRCAYEKNV